jgi:hypothetical protein
MVSVYMADPRAKRAVVVLLLTASASCGAAPSPPHQPLVAARPAEPAPAPPPDDPPPLTVTSNRRANPLPLTREQARDVSRCFIGAKELPVDPRVDLVIDATGRVYMLFTRGMSDEVAGCIDGVVRKWHFPPAESRIELSWPLH